MSKTTHPLDVIDWWQGPTPFVLFFTFLGAIIVFLTWHWTQSATEARVRAEEQASFDFRLETHILIECSETTGDEYQACVRDVVGGVAENKRNAQDLQAQQIMAYHTRVMGVMAVAALVVGGVSVGLLYATLAATQQMNSDQRKIAENQANAIRLLNRPWLKHTLTCPEGIQCQNERFIVHLNVDVENVGETAAFRALTRVYLTPFRSHTIQKYTAELATRSDSGVAKPSNIPPSSTASFQFVKSLSYDEWRSAANVQGQALYVYVVTVYGSELQASGHASVTEYTIRKRTKGRFLGMNFPTERKAFPQEAVLVRHVSTPETS